MWATIAKWTILWLLVLLITTSIFAEARFGPRGRRGPKKEEKKKDIKHVIKFEDLGLKILCEEEDWKAQFRPIKYKLGKCLGLEKLILDESERPPGKDDGFNSLLSPFRDSEDSPYCQLGKTWEACSHHFKDINCIEADTKKLLPETRVNHYKNIIDEILKKDKLYPEDDINAMTRVYKTLCETARFAAQQMKSMGGYGMDYPYYGDYDGVDGGNVDGVSDAAEGKPGEGGGKDDKGRDLK